MNFQTFTKVKYWDNLGQKTRTSGQVTLDMNLMERFETEECEVLSDDMGFNMANPHCVTRVCFKGGQSVRVLSTHSEMLKKLKEGFNNV